MKPNLKFDLHKDASFLRDETSAGSAHQKYERWLSAQDCVPESSQQAYKEENVFREIESELSTEAQLITLAKEFSGKFYLSKTECLFNDPEASKSILFLLKGIEMVLHRSYLHMDNGLEFFLVSKRSYFLYFPKGNRQRVIQILKAMSLPNLKVLQTGASREFIQPFTEKWRNGLMSNYQYLMYCNFFGGRSFNDLSQYPVFPWILTDYESPTLDLDDPGIYRNLSVPVGRLNEARFDDLCECYRQCPGDVPEKCLFRFHYSNAFYVLHFLVRVEPFTTLHIEVNDRKFDKPGRTFFSIRKSFQAITSRSSDFRELIPEFFTLPDFLCNDNHFDLGATETGFTDGVELPPWANGSPHKFIQLHRQALEGRHVSEHLQEWIDLIFGFSNSGAAAVKANNTFPLYSYQSSITKEVLRNPDMLKVIQTQASSLGIVPRQIFTSPHPKRIAPIQPNFANVQLTVLLDLGTIPQYLYLSRNVLYILSNACLLHSLTFPKSFRTTKFEPEVHLLGSLHEFLINSRDGDVIPSKSFVFLLHIGRLVISSLWDNTFHVFKIDSNSVSHLMSVRQKFSLLSTLNPAGESLLLASWRDSSLTLWNLAEAKSPLRPLYRRTPYLTSVVDVEANCSLGLVASLDKTRKCIFSMLDTGTFTRTFDVKGNDSLEKLILFSSGYLAVLSELVLANSATTTVRLYGVDTKLVCEREFDGLVAELCRVEFENALSGLAIAFKSGRLLMLRIPDLEMLFDLESQQQLNLITFSTQINALIIGTKTGELRIVSFD
jgi:hypothetical protein